MIDVQKSRFQVTKTQKMNIMKQSTNKYRPDYSFNIWIENFVRMNVCPNHNEALQIKHITSW